MTQPRSPRKPIKPKQPPLVVEESEQIEIVERVVEEPTQNEVEEEKTPEIPTKSTLEPTGVVFMSDEDKRLFKKYNSYIVKKLNLGGNRSFKV